MEYKKYQHIEKLGTTEVEGILEVQVSLFYKKLMKKKQAV